MPAPCPPVPATLTAALAVAVLSLTLCGCQPTASRTDAPPTANITIEAMGPKGAVTWPFVFEWKSAAGAGAVYRVTVCDLAERPLVEQETRLMKLEAPPGMQALLASTHRFLWRVAIVDGDGHPTVQTPLVEFAVK